MPSHAVQSMPSSVDPAPDGPMFDFSVVRELRKREGLTLGDVSMRSGVSVPVLSRLERNQSVAEIETLFKLSRVFGMNAADLLALAESRGAHHAAETRHKSGGFEFREVRYGNALCLYGRAKKGSTLSRPEIHGDDYEICWVLRGRLRIRLPHEVHDLAAGRAIQFDAILEHTYEALADCEIVIFHMRKGKRF
ncbi:MAG: helix-turn-helix domain-containing protein [Bryobacterales bacterium]|nr:helix-turn-helix domain-containing protein [Bryobacterales bacterium]